MDAFRYHAVGMNSKVYFGLQIQSRILSSTKQSPQRAVKIMCSFMWHVQAAKAAPPHAYNQQR